MAILEINNASKHFGTKQVLSDINLKLEEGEFVTVIGYSGSGKTTLLSLAAGLAKPDTGEVLVQGKKVVGPGPDRGVVFQNYSLLPWLTVEENVALAVEQVFPTYTKAQVASHVAKYVAMVKLTPAAKKLPRQLSGGMRQRVSLARGLAMEPKILLLDEPLSALDALTRANLQEDISEMRDEFKCTILWITNDPDEALLLGDRVIPLSPGPAATLKESLIVDIERPRDRREMTNHAHFQSLRLQLTEGLLAMRKTQQAETPKIDLEPPSILPEDLTKVNTFQFFSRRGPLRRGTLAPS